MNYLPTLNEDEIRYVCSVIPLKDSAYYFKKYPKEFAKIMPGFRAKSLRNQEQVGDILFRSRRHLFISSFIENHISCWLEQIQHEISILIADGEPKESAWLRVLPFCFFVDDIGIFFKLIGEDISPECISLLGLSIKMFKNSASDTQKNEELLSKKEEEYDRLKDEINHIQAEKNKSCGKLLNYSNEIKALKLANSDLKKLSEVVHTQENEIKRLKNDIQERDAQIQQLKTEISIAVNEQLLLKRSYNEEVKKTNKEKHIEQITSTSPRRPLDIDEFKDYLGYNLENLGVEITAEYYSLLKDYISSILFTGKPIIVSRNTGFPLMMCVSNALIASLTVATLVFSPEISVTAIEDFLSANNRIMCLDNFIGNFDETILFTICEKHKDKILFLTITYDKTLRYVPVEFLKYCNYLNINRIEAFIQGQELTEDPSAVEEVKSLSICNKSDVIWSTLIKEILEELNVCNGLSVYKSMLVSNEADLCQLLAFDVLPYCIDVLNSMPYDNSERLNKYAGDNGRCPYKELFRRWFS